MNPLLDNSVPTTLLAVVASLIIAAGGWLFTYFHSRATEARRARLARVNSQLRLLYGPLYARLLAGEAAWQAFSGNYWPAHGQAGFFTPGFETTDAEAARWRLWMREVFYPLNLKLESLITDHLDLLDGNEMPQAFVEALAHIAAYHAVLKQWEDGNFNENVSVVNFPGQKLLAVVKPQYEKLLRQRETLLAQTQ